MDNDGERHRTSPLKDIPPWIIILIYHTAHSLCKSRDSTCSCHSASWSACNP